MKNEPIVFRANDPQALCLMAAVWEMQKNVGDGSKSDFIIESIEGFLHILPRDYRGEVAIRAALINAKIPFQEFLAKTIFGSRYPAALLIYLE